MSYDQDTVRLSPLPPAPPTEEFRMFHLKVSCWLPWWLSGKESACQCRRHWFDPCSWRIPLTKKQLSPCVNPHAETTEACVPQQKKSPN